MTDTYSTALPHHFHQDSVKTIDKRFADTAYYIRLER